MTASCLAFIESNTSGIGRLFPRVATQLGYRPVLLTSKPSRYAYASQDSLEVIQTDTKSAEALLDICGRLANSSGLAGIMSSSEYYVGIAADIASRLGLNGPNAKAILACRDKRTQRTLLQAAAVGVPAFRSINSIRAACDAAVMIGFPVVVKPVSGTGSVGVKLCENANDVAIHAGALLRQRYNERGLAIPRRVLVEQMAVGPEYSAEVFGRAIVGVTKKHLGSLPYFVEIGHDYPAALKPETERLITQAVLRAVDVLGLGWGPAHIELRVAEAGVKIIEINPRLAGGYIPELVRLATGIDLIRETIKLVTGQNPRLQATANRYASIRFVLAPTDGRLINIEGISAAEQVSGVAEVQRYVGLGERICSRGDFRDRVGHVIATGDTHDASRFAAEQAHSMIRLNISTDSKSGIERI